MFYLFYSCFNSVESGSDDADYDEEPKNSDTLTEGGKSEGSKMGDLFEKKSKQRRKAEEQGKIHPRNQAILW